MSVQLGRTIDGLRGVRLKCGFASGIEGFDVVDSASTPAPVAFGELGVAASRGRSKAGCSGS